MKKLLLLLTAMLILSSTVVCAERETFKSADGMYEYTKDGVITAYYGDEFAFFPAEIDGTKINEIGVMACFDLGVEYISVAEGIELINTNAFEGSNAKTAYIPSSVKNIGERAFANCTNLNEVTLNSEEITFDFDVFNGTGFIQFYIPCTADENAMYEKISVAKGDGNFSFSLMHTDLVESMEEKDLYGANMIYCNDCGFKGSKYFDAAPLPFADVSADTWYYPYVQIAYEFGIIRGKSETEFDPDAGLTCAEAAKIAAVIHDKNRYDREEQGFVLIGENWYDAYVSYCYDNGIIEDHIVFDWNANATRAQLAYLFSRCDVNPYFINDVPITDIPDVYDTTPFAYEILDLYNKGIAVGSDEFMAYYPDSQVKRSEAAALISRILCYDMRVELPKG